MRDVAIVDHEVSTEELDVALVALERYVEHMAELGFDISLTHIGSTSNLGLEQLPEPREDGAFWEYNMDGILYPLKFGLLSRQFVKGYSDIMLVIGRRMFMQTDEGRWHVKLRGGEGYGFEKNYSGQGGYCVFTTAPLKSLPNEDLKQRYLDYIIRHEFGHLFIPMKDLPQNTKDCVMRPIEVATPEYLIRKNVDYTEGQIRSMCDTFQRWNTDTINVKILDH